MSRNTQPFFVDLLLLMSETFYNNKTLFTQITKIEANVISKINNSDIIYVVKIGQ